MIAKIDIEWWIIVDERGRLKRTFKDDLPEVNMPLFFYKKWVAKKNCKDGERPVKIKLEEILRKKR